MGDSDSNCCCDCCCCCEPARETARSERQCPNARRIFQTMPQHPSRAGSSILLRWCAERAQSPEGAPRQKRGRLPTRTPAEAPTRRRRCGSARPAVVGFVMEGFQKKQIERFDSTAKNPFLACSSESGSDGGRENKKNPKRPDRKSTRSHSRTLRMILLVQRLVDEESGRGIRMSFFEIGVEAQGQTDARRR